MFLKLFLAFTLIPVIELYLLIKIGSVIGALETIAVIILTGVVGASLARSQGTQILLELKNSLQSGKNPSNHIIQGIMVLIGGFTLLTPGFLTDLIGLSLILPVTRRLYAKGLEKYFEGQVSRGRWVVVDDDVIEV